MESAVLVFVFAWWWIIKIAIGIGLVALAIVCWPITIGALVCYFLGPFFGIPAIILGVLVFWAQHSNSSETEDATV